MVSRVGCVRCVISITIASPSRWETTPSKGIAPKTLIQQAQAIQTFQSVYVQKAFGVRMALIVFRVQKGCTVLETKRIIAAHNFHGVLLARMKCLIVFAKALILDQMVVSLDFYDCRLFTTFLTFCACRKRMPTVSFFSILQRGLNEYTMP